jgi:solute carrier family 25 (mitochondrial carnitine/acylcarnitine transporter), member 20/29
MVYEGALNVCEAGLGSRSGVAQIMAGGTAGVVSWLVCYPVDMAKTRIQASTGRVRGVVATMQGIVRAGGRQELFRGVSSTLVRAFPASAVTFWIYEVVARWCYQSWPSPP